MGSLKTLLGATLPLLFLAFASAPAPAQILFDNGSAALGSGGYGYYADAGNSSYTEAGDVFTPTLSGTANYVSFAGLYYGGSTPTTDSFVLSLYSTTAGAPGTLISSSLLPIYSRAVLGSGESQTVYEFSGLLQTPLTLTTGTSYYFGITDTSDPYKNFAFVVSSSVPPGGSTSEYSRIAGTSTFVATGPDALSFQLESIPEPGEWGLLALGAGGLFLAGRSARRSSRI
jgi:hypothetical protein